MRGPSPTFPCPFFCLCLRDLDPTLSPLNPTPPALPFSSHFSFLIIKHIYIMHANDIDYFFYICQVNFTNFRFLHLLCEFKTSNIIAKTHLI